MSRAAADLGCRIFALTGGEPLVHPELDRVLDGLLGIDGTEVAILTNGMSLDRRPHLHQGELAERVHLQVSVDGLRERHDRIRGDGAFDRVVTQLQRLSERGRPFTVSMSVNRDNAADMPRVVDLAADLGASHVHFMWYFIRGRAARDTLPDMEALGRVLIEASERAEARGVTVDNVDAVRTQVFSPPGTKHDGGSSGWVSVALGPDGRLYPSPATIGLDELSVEVNGDLAAAWREAEPLRRWREATAAGSDSPWRFLLGGGDPDHSVVHGGTPLGADPYQPMHERLALHLIAREAASCPAGEEAPRLRLKMGDVLERCHTHGPVALTHSNCLLALSSREGITAIKDLYSEAAKTERADIVNPVCYEEPLIRHIPPGFRFRGYGCGSPVQDADIAAGETVVDLGSGTGIECFIASKLVGSTGRVIGVDMLDPMLERAREAAPEVARKLGWANVEFRKGYLEHLPLEDDSVDLILSNCVLNLSMHKRKTFSEIFRVLRPSGRLVVSDVVCEEDPGPAIRNDDALRGECLGGALTQRDLFGLLDESGFELASVLARHPYREVDGHPFFSMTFSARKPSTAAGSVRVMYRGPFSAVVASDGTVLPAGQTVELDAALADEASEQLFVFADGGAVDNADLGQCACLVSPEATSSCCAPSTPEPRSASGCMVCGGELAYSSGEAALACHYCGREERSAMSCPEGHFVCDRCHAEDALSAIESICSASRETDMIALLSQARAHPAINVHGPEHHSLVPAIIVATARNAGFPVPEKALSSAIRRGAKVPGGSCGYMGVCGAASGVGTGFSVLLEATPLTPVSRQQVLSVVGAVTSRLASLRAARCCQRDCYLALRVAAEWAPELVGVSPTAVAPLRCAQIAGNPECLGTSCPLHPGSAARFDRTPLHVLPKEIPER
jgi:MoaA/NifB/PqqE/SkfB family radical SAM enzyme/SAM-dependent methyltransferase